MTNCSLLLPEVQAVRQRFTPARWGQFKRDMRYFQDLIGPGGYLGSLTDHGGNVSAKAILAQPGAAGRTPSLAAQRLHRSELGCAPGRIHAETDAHAASGEQRRE